MSAQELREAVETLAAEWEQEDDDTTVDVAGALALIDLLREASDFFEALPRTVKARALTFARLVNGGAS